MEGQIPDDVKHERFNRLVEVINRKAGEINQKAVGRVYEILVEGPSKNNEEFCMGRTRGGKLVNFRGDASLIGKLIPVMITRANSFSLTGERVE